MTDGYNEIAVAGLTEYLKSRTRDPRPVTEAEVAAASRAADDIALPAEEAAALPLIASQSLPDLLRNFNVIAARVALEVRGDMDRLNQQYLDRAAEAMEDEVEEWELAASTRVARR